MHWQPLHRDRRFLTGRAHNTPGAHPGQVAMVASISMASCLQVVVAEGRRSAFKNGGKPVSDAHQSHHDSVLSSGENNRTIGRPKVN